MAAEVILEVRGLDGPTVRSCLEELGGRQCTPRRMRGPGWTAVVQEDVMAVGPFELERVLLHLLGAPGPVKKVVCRLHELTDL